MQGDLDHGVNNNNTINIQTYIQYMNQEPEDGPQTIPMGNAETVKYFVCAVKGGKHCNRGKGNQRLRVRVGKYCQTGSESQFHFHHSLFSNI